MSLLIGASSGLQGAAGASAGGAADLGDTINQSLRFRNSTLSRTLTNHTSFTASMWIKRGLFGTEQTFFEFSAADADLRFTANDELKYYDNATAGTSDKLFRDPSAWYHIVLAYDNDGTGGLGSDTVRVYVNGADSGLRTSAGGNSGGGSTVLGSSAFQGYIAEFNYVQSTQLPTAFGKYNEDGVWVPITFAGTYGAQGVHLVFDSSAGIGDDTSGNGLDFSASGFETTAISSSNFDNDIDYNDTPTSNYGTANPVGTTVGSFTEANLFVDTSSNGTWQACYGTFPMQSGKWYWEVEANQTDMMIGISSNHRAAPTYASQTGEIAFRGQDGRKWNGNVNATYGGTYTTGDVVGIAFDADNGNIWFSVNGTWQNSATQAEIEAGTTTNAAYTSLADGIYVPAHFNVDTGGQRLNYGQRVFEGTKPSGYEALNTNKLAEPTIKNGSDYFRALTGTGANILAIASGTNTSGTNWNDDVNTGFTSGLWWIKDRDNSNQHQLVDSVRGTSLASTCPQSTKDTSYSAPSGNSVAWCWQSGEASTSGFNIITYTGNSSSTQAVAHGLPGTPEFIITASRGSSPGGFETFHTGCSSGKSITIDSGRAESTSSRYSGVDATNITYGGDYNTDGQNMIAYAWTSIEGHSKFGSYTGNGSGTSPDADGAFIYLGFRPALVMIKRIDSASGGEWSLYDSTRRPINANRAVLSANNQMAETTMDGLDLLSNGFKVRGGSGTWINVSGGSYVYMAWAESPFGGENAPPATAR